MWKTYVRFGAEMPNPTEYQPEQTEHELSLPQWAVISFAKCEASGLTYDQAVERQAEFDRQRVPGLVVVTDAAAARYQKLLAGR